MKSIAAIFLLSIFLNTHGQQPLSDSAIYTQSILNATAAYKKQVQDNLHLFNGEEYFRIGHGVKGTPFFVTDSILPGAVFYDGRLYEDVPLHYDIVSDNVIVNNYGQNNEIKLVPEKLLYFIASQHLFVRLTADSLLPSFITTGFYEKLYDGKIGVFARHKKILRTSASADTESKYNEYDYYFVFANNTFYRADDKSDFLAAMSDRKEQIKKYIKDNKINFNKKREAAMVQVAEYYSQIKN